jgi:hypothetical protein
MLKDKMMNVTIALSPCTEERFNQSGVAINLQLYTLRSTIDLSLAVCAAVAVRAPV